MPYGQGGRLGERIDPRLMQVDFSGVERAGATAGAALNQAGNDIGDLFRERGEQERFIKKSEKIAKDIGELIPELKPQTTAALTALTNPDASRRDRLAMAESIRETLQIGMMGIQNQREKEMMALRRASMAQRGEKAPGVKIGPIMEYKTANGETKQFQVVSVNGQETMMSPEEALKLSRGVQSAIGISDAIALPEQQWGGVPLADPNAAIQGALGVPTGSAMGVVPAAQKDQYVMAPQELTEQFGPGQINQATGEFKPIRMTASSQELGSEYKKIADKWASGDKAEAYTMFRALGDKGFLGEGWEAADLETFVKDMKKFGYEPLAQRTLEQGTGLQSMWGELKDVKKSSEGKPKPSAAERYRQISGE